MEEAGKVLADTYFRQPVVFVKGDGMTLWDDTGKSYLDFVAGVAVCILGHSHPAVAEALNRQARELVHVSNLFFTEPQVKLARWLTDRSFADRAFFCNSGAEANEAAIKLTRIYQKSIGQTDRYRIITAQKSFHGRTLTTLSATGQEKIHKGFEPLVDGFDYVPYNDLSAAEGAVGPKTAGIMMEPVQGEGGVVVPDKGYLAGLREICDRRGLLLIYDEVQTGMGRTGPLFGYMRENVPPDIMTLAKGLGNGLPVGAMLATEKAMAAFTPGTHASTFGGTPLVCAAALAVCKTLEKEGVLEKAQMVSAYFIERLKALAEKHDVADEVRGRGLLLGLKLKKDAGALVGAMREKGYLVNCTQGDVLRFIPPLIVQKEHVDLMIETLDGLLAEF
ncbi:MAG: aspartate aminotransferase family protein [Deltaproteobacteria bacterium]|nr:aspartate aminotransferase family protein [Deltaproteobacteria bacterium]